MLDEGVSRVTYSNVVGVGLHISTMEQIADESYAHLIMEPNTTRLQVMIKDRLVTYDF